MQTCDQCKTNMRTEKKINKRKEKKRREKK